MSRFLRLPALHAQAPGGVICSSFTMLTKAFSVLLAEARALGYELW